MGRSKQDKFRDNERRNNIIQPGKVIFNQVKGKWHELYFKNSNPIVLELACGKGEYTVEMARIFSGKNFIGVDIKGSRLWKGSGLAECEALTNAAFLRIQILDLENFFDPCEVDDIWITFPDPRPRDRDLRRRLTGLRFLKIYRNIIKPGGWIYLKTDNSGLFDYTLEVVSDVNFISNLKYTYDLYSSELLDDHYGIQTTYEKRFIENNIKIKYLKFQIIK